jgi:hypothetical protein
MSLAVSVLSFYYSNLVARHNLSATVEYKTWAYRDISKIVKDGSSKFQVTVTIRNDGNRTEAVLRLAIYSVGSSSGPSAFVLKPGDVQVFNIEEDMNILRANLAAAAAMAKQSGKDPGDWTEFGIISRVVMPNGSIAEKLSPLGSVRDGAADTNESPHADVKTNSNIGTNIRLLSKTIWL